jgi:chromosome segregation ATPase
MLNPLSLPAELTAALRSVTNIERLFESMNVRMAELPDAIEATLRGHFEGQRSDLAELHRELVANRRTAEQLPPKIDALRADIAGLRTDMQSVLAEISEVRETVEPLQGPAERVARLSERLPGNG